MEDSKIKLRTINPTDQNMILRILTDNQVKKTFILPDFVTPEAALPLCRRLEQLSTSKTRFVRCIALDDAPIGFINDVEIDEDSIELGYVIHPDFHGKGYMTAALDITMKELAELGYRKVLTAAFEENTASIRVMEKCGMTKISRTDLISYRDNIHRCIYYQRLLK